jgi:hypothetical protein
MADGSTLMLSEVLGFVEDLLQPSLSSCALTWTGNLKRRVRILSFRQIHCAVFTLLSSISNASSLVLFDIIRIFSCFTCFGGTPLLHEQGSNVA